ncbi:hypothetical protein PIB30_066616 [Stylosanthes scabra]|uniref:Uncharacterized protein n=1 Tax=Stylosanthes scabra TaxID=79078 RepID=A0ABU6RMD8_9FABA|nr:hypothetical protein [Stylosanthes scabra]
MSPSSYPVVVTSKLLRAPQKPPSKWKVSEREEEDDEAAKGTTLVIDLLSDFKVLLETLLARVSPNGGAKGTSRSHAPPKFSTSSYMYIKNIMLM